MCLCADLKSACVSSRSSIYHLWHLVVLVLSAPHLKRTHFSHQKSHSDFCVRVLVILPSVSSISTCIFAWLRSFSFARSPLPSVCLWTCMLSEYLGLHWCPASWKYPLSFPLPATQWVIFNKPPLSALHPLSACSTLISATLAPSPAFFFFFGWAHVTWLIDNISTAVRTFIPSPLLLLFFPFPLLSFTVPLFFPLVHFALCSCLCSVKTCLLQSKRKNTENSEITNREQKRNDARELTSRHG